MRLLELATLVVESTTAGVAEVWLSRPDRRNALSAQALMDIETAFTWLNTAFDYPICLLGGRGVGFSCGADLRDPPDSRRADPNNGRAQRWAMQLGRRAIEAIERCEAITIARVHGFAIGGGFGLMQACDLRVCTEDTKLSLPEVDLGIPLTWGLTARLIRDVGRAKAMELITLCDRLPPKQGVDLGLINAVLRDEKDMDKHLSEWTANLVAKGSTVLQMVKVQFRALDRQAVLGDCTESDNDLLFLSSLLNSNKHSKL